MTALTLSGAGETAIMINRADVGTAITVDYASTVLGFPTSSLGAIGSFVYTGASSDGRTYNFSYGLTNDSSATSRLRSFGFDILGSTTIAALASTGTYATPIQNPLSGLLGTDVCFTAGGLGSCSTGSGGFAAGQSGAGTFALTFANAMASVQLSDFVVSFQGVNGFLAGSGSGDATVTVPVSTGPISPVVVSTAPENSTWAMMMLGFGVMGWLLRRRDGVAGMTALRG